MVYELGHDAGGEIVFLHFSFKNRNLHNLRVVRLDCGCGAQIGWMLKRRFIAIWVLICFFVTGGSCLFIHRSESGGIFSFFFIILNIINLLRRACPWGGGKGFFFVRI